MLLYYLLKMIVTIVMIAAVVAVVAKSNLKMKKNSCNLYIFMLLSHYNLKL